MQRSNIKMSDFLSFSVDLSPVMTALWKLGKFNLTMLMSSLISLWFGKGFFYFNNMTRLIGTPRGPLMRTLCVVSSEPAVRITGFDCITISIHGVTPCPPVPSNDRHRWFLFVRCYDRRFMWPWRKELLSTVLLYVMLFALSTISIGRWNHCV